MNLPQLAFLPTPALAPPLEYNAIILNLNINREDEQHTYPCDLPTTTLSGWTLSGWIGTLVGP